MASKFLGRFFWKTHSVLLVHGGHRRWYATLEEADGPRGRKVAPFNYEFPAETALRALNACRDAAGLRGKPRLTGRRTLIPSDARIARRDAAAKRPPRRTRRAA